MVETLKYKPDAEKIVQLHQNKPKEKATATELTETNNTIDKNTKYLNESNFRFQIGKMQEDWWTIYSDEMLKIWIEYIINHTKKWEHSIIQIRSDVWDLLQQWSEEWVLTSEEQKKKIEHFIKNNFWKKWERIKVIIWSEQYPEVFEALQQWKDWIIPKEEPNIREYLSTTSKEELSPLPIIQYLAYHANKDPELMQLFYNTKPKKYTDEDSKLWKKPWDSNADFYWIVEVWLRLTEILKWISIQWWVWRQRVYDKIISLIINWKDIIKKREEFDCNYILSPKDYPALEKLHKVCKEHYPNTKFNQLYIELDRTWLDKIVEKMGKRHQLINKIRYSSLISFILLWWISDTPHINKLNNGNKNDTEITDLEKYPTDELEAQRIRSTYPEPDSLNRLAQKFPYHAIHIINYPDKNEYEYPYEQEQILIAAYDLSKFNYIHHGLVDDWLMKNKIIDEYNKISQGNYRAYKKHISAKDFMDNYIEVLAGDYHIEHQEPYAHWWKYIQYIENTLKYWDKIDISKYKVEEKEERWYFNEENHQPYKVKFVKVYLENDQTIDLILAAKNYQYPEEFTLQNWLLCMKDLVSHYWKNIWISNIE